MIFECDRQWKQRFDDLFTEIILSIWDTEEFIFVIHGGMFVRQVKHFTQYGGPVSDTYTVIMVELFCSIWWL